MAVRQAFLMMVDAIERELGIKPRTSQLRKFWKDWKESGKSELKKG